MTLGETVQTARDVFSLVWPVFLTLSGFVTAVVNRLSPETKARLITGRPYLAAVLDVVASIGINAPQFKRGASGLTRGAEAPANVEVKRIVESDDNDVDGITLTPAAPLLPPEMRVPPKTGEHFVLVQSLAPPPVRGGAQTAVTVPPLPRPRVTVPDDQEIEVIRDDAR